MIRHKHRDRLRWISVHVPFLPERVRTVLYEAGRRTAAPPTNQPGNISGDGTPSAPYSLQ